MPDNSIVNENILTKYFSGGKTTFVRSRELTEDEKLANLEKSALLQAVDYAKRHNVDSVRIQVSEDKIIFDHLFTKSELENGESFYKEMGWDKA